MQPARAQLMIRTPFLVLAMAVGGQDVLGFRRHRHMQGE